MTAIVIDRLQEDFSWQKSIVFCNLSPLPHSSPPEREGVEEKAAGVSEVFLPPADPPLSFLILVPGRWTCPAQPACPENVGRKKLHSSCNGVFHREGEAQPICEFFITETRQPLGRCSGQRCFKLETGTRWISELSKTLE